MIAPCELRAIHQSKSNARLERARGLVRQANNVHSQCEAAVASRRLEMEYLIDLQMCGKAVGECLAFRAERSSAMDTDNALVCARDAVDDASIAYDKLSRALDAMCRSRVSLEKTTVRLLSDLDNCDFRTRAFCVPALSEFIESFGDKDLAHVKLCGVEDTVSTGLLKREFLLQVDTLEDWYDIAIAMLTFSRDVV